MKLRRWRPGTAYRLAAFELAKRGKLDTVTARLPWGRLMVRPNGPMAKGAYVWRNWSTADAELLRSMVRLGDVVWDVGAHYGVAGLLAKRLSGPAGYVHSFEPFPESFAILKGNAARVLDWKAHRLALGATEGELRMARPGGQHCAHVVEPDALGDVYRVPATTLDAQAEALGVPDVVKIDVEGHEGAVLAGGERLIRRGETSWVVECHSRRLRDEVQEALLVAGDPVVTEDQRRWFVSVERADERCWGRPGAG